MEENRRLYDDYYKDTNTRILSNIENHDKAILSLSTAILGVSLAFIKDVISIDKAIGILILEISWLVLILAIVFVIFSFITGNKANLKHLEFAEDYYLNDNNDAFNKRSKWLTTTEYLNFASGIFFIFGIILTAVFVSLNINNKGDVLSKNIERGANASNMQPKSSNAIQQKANDGAPPPKMPVKSNSNSSSK